MRVRRPPTAALFGGGAGGGGCCLRPWFVRPAVPAAPPRLRPDRRLVVASRLFVGEETESSGGGVTIGLELVIWV